MKVVITIGLREIIFLLRRLRERGGGANDRRLVNY
jgi:hypothetical protein